MENYRACSTCKQIKPFSAFNSDKSRKYGISYRCKECHSEINKKYRYSKEKSREAAKAHYWRNRDAINAKAKEFRKANPEKVNEWRQRYAAKNKDKQSARMKNWRKNNKSKVMSYKTNRRARLRAGDYEYYSVQDVLNKYGIVCYLCSQEINLDAPRHTGSEGWKQGLQIDHVIPIRLGGPDTLSNVRPTHGICNAKKH